MDALDIDGVRLECRWIGMPLTDTPVLVFLHEGLGSAALWRDFPDRVAAAAGLPAFVYSRRGYGGSDPVPLPRPMDYLEREARDVLPLVLEAAGIRSAVLVGHSDGATIALVHAAQDRGGVVRAVAALAPHTFVEDMCVAAIAKVRDTYAEHLRPRLARHHGANVDCAFHGWNDTWLDPRFKAMEYRPLLANITVPVTVIQGADDEYATRAQVDAVADGVSGPVRAILLPDCGHSPQRDQPEAVTNAILDLIRPLSG
ncbi:alpha/beta hydrolase [Magnetospirillum aberrantis]